jgi:murein DD-endopeptidase MepM/ murein hydrolase activator NlpD
MGRVSPPLMPFIHAALLMASSTRLAPPVAPYGLEKLPVEWVSVPMIFPLAGRWPWRDTYNQVRGEYRHTGQDIRAPKMTPILAPFAGRIGFKRESFWIYGDNGWRCLATHLNDDTPGTNDNQGGWDTMFAPNLEQGGRVEAGQLIGYVGDSGRATGPHLHFEIHGPNGIRNPRASLKNAQVLTRPKAVQDSPEDVPAPGQERWDVCWRKLERDSGMLGGLIVSRQMPGKEPVAEDRPTFAWVRMRESAAAGGPTWDEIQNHPPHRPLRLFIQRVGGKIEVDRMALPSQPVKSESSALWQSSPADSS